MVSIRKCCSVMSIPPCIRPKTAAETASVFTVGKWANRWWAGCSWKMTCVWRYRKNSSCFWCISPSGIFSVAAWWAAKVLVRWKHPLKGLISPDVFIPLAEETGLILPLGNWILRTALAQARSWKDQQLPDFTLAINLSTAQLNAGLPRQIAAMLRSYELAPGRLELEVTETLLMTAPEESTRVLGELKKTGIRIALDDFGTGYSSLAYLSRLPLDVLKIDKSFVDGLPDRQDDVVIARLIIRMAAQLGMITLAEGVENEAQLRFLKEAGCHLMQGYLKARPLPPEEVAALVSKIQGV
ncbi:EAL domain-containing protein [Venatoribacter cucullus]|nr:EAL domain-containing protein [Venatoribacter cucullus]